MLSYLRQKDSQIVLLQETHLLQKDTHRIHDKWIGGAYHNTFNQKQRGVSILFSKKLQFKVEKKFKDKEGRLLILLVNISGKKIILGNLYAPNIEDPDFFLQIKKYILDFGDYPVALGGDYN